MMFTPCFFVLGFVLCILDTKGMAGSVWPGAFFAGGAVGMRGGIDSRTNAGLDARGFWGWGAKDRKNLHARFKEALAII